MPSSRKEAQAERYDDGTSATPGGIQQPAELVLVVGAGIAGLTVANALRHGGVNAVVLEARSRIGGRLHTFDLAGSRVDLGGSWIHSPIGNPMSRFAAQVGVACRPGNFVLEAVGWDPLDGRLGADHFARLLDFQGQFEEAVEGLRIACGPEASLAVAIDRFVREQHLNSTEALRLAHFLRVFAEADAGEMAERISLRWHPGSSLEYEGDYLGDLPVGGYGSIVAAMAAGLDVRLGLEVTAIAWDERGVRLTTSAGQTYSGSHVVVTVPLGVLKADAIQFDPPLPLAHRSAIDRLGFGRFEKVALKFAEPFWTAAGFPHLISAPHDGRPVVPFLMGLDRFVGDAVLVAAAYGSFVELVAGGSEASAVARVRGMLEQMIGEPTPEPLAAVRTGWGTDPYTRGAYTNVPLGAQPADLDQLAEPIGGRVLFAGEATTSARVGFADGAMTTGVREAKRLLRQPEVELGRL